MCRRYSGGRFARVRLFFENPIGYHFVAYASKDRILADVISSAVRAADGGEHEYRDWARQDASGAAIQHAVEGWLRDSAGIVADISLVNDNVTFEIGFSIGLGKDLRLVRHAERDFKHTKDIGLLADLIHDAYGNQSQLTEILRKSAPPKNRWGKPRLDRDQPIYVMSPHEQVPVAVRAYSLIKKTVREKFRSFKPWEVGRITAAEVWENVSASLGVVTFWLEGSSPEATVSNQRSMLAFGMARGLDIPTLLLAPTSAELPLDVSTKATRYSSLDALDPIFRRFRDDVSDARQNYVEEQTLPLALLDRINIGDPAAENEQDRLSEYFLDTEEFRSTLSGQTNIIIGRKGCGKTAIFLQVRDRTRQDKRNIVVDLNPEGAQLVKLKERMVEIQSLGARKEFITAFWQYVVWLEIAYKILEKDERASRYDWELNQRYERLQAAFKTRVDTGVGDFSERLRLLIELITARYETKSSEKPIVASSTILEIVYGQDVAAIRDEVLSYLRSKGRVLFLFDNIDRMRAPGGFDDGDAVVIVGLVESMQEMQRSFRRAKLEFQWAVFLRSDVYQFVCKTMADYGKLAERQVEWIDRALMSRLIATRIQAAAPDGRNRDWVTMWAEVSESEVDGKSAMDFMIDASMMRPRYLIRMFETAKRRAVNLGRQKIGQEDYKAALEELAWTALADLGRELTDVVSSAENLIFDVAELEGACGLPELRDAIEKRIGQAGLTERVIDVLLWSGCIGIDAGKGPTFIFDCGYQLSFLRATIDRNPDAEVRLHPTLSSLFG